MNSGYHSFNRFKMGVPVLQKKVDTCCKFMAYKVMAIYMNYKFDCPCN